MSVVVTKDAASALAPFQGRLASTIVSDPQGKVASSLSVSLLPQVAHFAQGGVIWSKPSQQTITDAVIFHIRELGFKEMEGALRKPLKKEIARLKSLSETQGCSNEKKQ